MTRMPADILTMKGNTDSFIVEIQFYCFNMEIEQPTQIIYLLALYIYNNQKRKISKNLVKINHSVILMYTQYAAELN